MVLVTWMIGAARPGSPYPSSADSGVLEWNMSTRGRRFLGTLLAIYCAVTSAQPASWSLEGRDPGVQRWISYEILGPSNHPDPIAYLSTRSFETTRNEFLAVLSTAKFDAISENTLERINGDDCPGKNPQGNIWYTVKISRRDGTPLQNCILPQKQACEYLTGVIRLVRDSWTPEELRPLTIFVGELWCDSKAPQNAAGSDRR